LYEKSGATALVIPGLTPGCPAGCLAGRLRSWLAGRQNSAKFRIF